MISGSSYGIFKDVSKDITSQLGTEAGKETYKYFIQYIKNINERLDILLKKLNNQQGLDSEETVASVLKDAYATISQIREILTNNVIQYRVYYNSDNSNIKSNYNTIELSMDELLNHGVSNNLGSFKSNLNLVENQLKDFAITSGRGQKATTFSNRMSKVQEYMEKIQFSDKKAGYVPSKLGLNELTDNELMALVSKKKLKQFQEEYAKHKGDRSFLEDEKIRSKYFRSYTLGHLGEGIDRSKDDDSWTIGKFMTNDLRWDSVAGYRGGDTGDWQIKMGNARLMRTSTIKGYLTSLQKVFTAIENQKRIITTSMGKEQDIAQYVKNIFSISPTIDNSINTMIENSINGIFNEFANTTQKNLSSQNANVSWSQ